MLLFHFHPHMLLAVLQESPALALKAFFFLFFPGSLGYQRGDRKPKENSACLMTMDDILTDKALRSRLHLVFQLLFMKLMKTTEHTVSRQVLWGFLSLLIVLCE